eukprot:TRINITY_DN27241_c0_g1_i1.p1 TRINITY_DN27241_c0_g1~~TRINITY_DN27241_c0_g1_i1.p1  ORF type:complete len:770 (+),score=300.21 TRINITY_DN27241_c0_g1_i1:64-2373(+)
MLPTPASHAVQASPSMLPADYLSPHAGPALADMTRENDMLRRKVKFLQHVGGVFRQKIGALFSEAAQRGDPGMKKLNAVYRSLVEEMPSFEEVSPQRHHAGYVQGAPETSEGKYWHEKFMTATHKMKSLLGTQTDTENQMAEDLRMLQEQLNMAKKQNAELRKCLDAMDVGSPRVPVPAESPRLSAMDELRGLSPGLLETRALAESDAATQMVIASMKDDNQNLTTQLNDALERLRTSDTVQQDCTLLQKQNNLLRNRLHKVKDTNAQLKLESSSTVIEMQNNISTLLTSLNEANEVIAGKDTQIALLDETKENLIKDMQAMHHVVTTYKNKVTEYEAQAMAKTKDEQRAMDQFEKEKFQLHQEVKDGEEKIGGLSGKLDELSNQVQQQLLTLRDNSYHIELLSMEKLNLNERIEQMDMLLQERSQFGTVLGEVETRLRDAVCDLHGVQSTQHVADRMRELSDSVTALEGLEGQLKIKDDTLAAREDEILKLKDAMHILEDSVNQISSMFLQMPKTVEEMEKIIIERDTYRASIEEQRPEWLDGLHEMVSIKLIEKNVMKKPLPKESREKKCISEELLKLQPIPSPNEAQEDAIMGLAAKTLQALGHSGGEIDSDEELLKDPPRSASTLGAIYESIYGKADGTAATTIPGAAAPSLTELARASVTPQHLPAPRPPLSPALGAGMPEPLPPPQPAPPAPPVAPSLDLQPNDIVHAFRAFESNGRMDADHFKTCVLALGLAYSTAADGIVAPHKSLDLETFQRAILLCEAH